VDTFTEIEYAVELSCKVDGEFRTYRDEGFTDIPDVDVTIRWYKSYHVDKGRIFEYITHIVYKITKVITMEVI